MTMGARPCLASLFFLTRMGRRLIPFPRTIAEATAQQMRRKGGRDWPWLHLDSIKRQLDREALEYRQ
jgi:hypothetical protein